MALRVSAAYAVPYDIEWARFGDQLYLLQARPITSFCCAIDGLWSHAGFDSSSVLTLSMSAHAYASFMAKTLGKENLQVSKMMYCRSYIDSELWRSFGKELKKLRKNVSLSDLVAQTEDLIQTKVARAEELRRSDDFLLKDSPIERMQLLLKEQDEFNQVKL